MTLPDRLAAEKRAGQVHLQRLFPQLERVVFERREIVCRLFAAALDRQSGVVDEDVDAAELLRRRPRPCARPGPSP